MTKDKISKKETNCVTPTETSKSVSNKINYLYYTIPGFLVFITIVSSYGAYLLHTQLKQKNSLVAQSQPKVDVSKKALVQSGLTIDHDYRPSGGYLVISAEIDGKHFHLDVADNNQTRARGLSFRENLAPRTGMIFIFDSPSLHGIWMKDMNFAIDILWVNKDGTVVHSETNVSPETYPTVLRPPVASDYVVELPAGTWQKNSILTF